MENFSFEELEKIKNGDTEPLQKVFLSHYEYCTECLIRYDSCSKADAKDSAMDAIQILRDKIIQGSYLNQNLRAFLLTVSRNRLRNKRKRDRKSLPFDPTIVEAYLNNTDSSSGLTEFQQRKIDVVLLAIKQIEGVCQKLLKLNLYEGISLEVLQKDLGYKSLDVIKNTKSRCLKKFKQMVNKMMQNKDHYG